MSPVLTIADRYQITGQPVGEGGMGVVYKAYDPVTRRYVAVKTMRGAIDNVARELFHQEWTVLSRINHPNIVDIFDTGEFELSGQRKPFFVMPFLPGRTFDFLIRNASQRLTVERVIEIMVQTCRGLQAAHENGLIHRDVKPSNIFVMDDDTVKVIDFGVAHLAGTDTVTGIKGTLQYMSPEQLEMKPTSPASDIYSLAVVCYEALTLRKPFERRTNAETFEAIRRQVPPPACDLNPLVSQLLSRVIHKALAKAPYNRFSTAREFAEVLQKALNNQPIERFDKSKLQPRIERARKAQAEGDLQFASEVLAELEAEGHFDPEMTVLRLQINQAIHQKSIRQLLDGARTRREEDELPLALQKIGEVLEIDPENADALSLRSDIEKERSERQIENWFRLAEQHLHHHSFPQARQALQEVLKIDAANTRAREALLDIDRREQEIARIRAEKEQLYKAALSSYQNGEVSSALSKLERVLEFSRTAPESGIPDRDAQYQGLYNEIRTERDAAKTSYAEGRRCLADRNFERALGICDEFLKRYPTDPLFQALKIEAEENRRQERSSFIADVARRVEAEPDLDRRVNILKEAAERYPDETHFQQSLRLIRDRRDLVNSIVAKARQYEERGQLGESLGQWDILRNIYAQYPGVEFEIERVTRHRDEQLRAEARAGWVDQIDRALAGGDYSRARDLAQTALREFPDDGELTDLERLSGQALERANQAVTWLEQGQKLCSNRQYGEGIECLRKAAALDSANPAIRTVLLNALVEQARSVVTQDWRAADALIQQALQIDPGHPLARSLQGLVLDHRRQEIVNESSAKARDLQATGDVAAAVATLDEALKSFPNDPRLLHLRSALNGARPPLPVPVEPAQPAPPPSAPPARAEAAAVGSASAMASASVAEPISPEKPVNGTLSLGPEPTWQPMAPATPSVLARDDGKTEPSAIPAALADKPAIPVRRSLMPRFSPLQWGAFASFPIIVGIAILVSNRHQTPSNAGVARNGLVRVETGIGGAEIIIDGKPVTSFPVLLSAGRHVAEAKLPGYRTATRVFTVSTKDSRLHTINLRPEPEPVRLRFSSDLKAGQIMVDGQPPSDLLEGGFSFDHLALSANHTLSVTKSGQEYFSASFHAEPGKPAILSSPLRTGEPYVLVVSNLGAYTRIWSSNSSLKAGLAGQTPQAIAPEGLEFKDLKSDSEVVIADGSSMKPLPVEISNVPALKILLSSDIETATLRVQASVPDADVTVQGRKPRRIHGASTSLLLPPGSYAIKVSKPGYKDETQTVELKKGGAITLPAFVLKPVVVSASLEIQSGTPGAEVWIDGQKAGALDLDGAFSKAGLSPENHSIRLKKTDFEDKEIQTPFTAGQTVRLADGEARLTPFAVLVFHVVPETSTISWRREQDTQPHPVANGSTIHLPAGRYVISASANDRGPRSETVNIAPNLTFKVDWFLSMTAKPVPVKIERHTCDGPSWSQTQDGWLHHEGKETAWCGGEGVFRFTIHRPQRSRFPFGKSRLEWVVDWTGAEDHIEYLLDQKSIERRVSKEGAATTSTKKPAAMAASDTWNLDIDINRNRIEIRSDGKLLDRFDRPRPDEPVGKFGFEGEVELKTR
jgi:serine/threonine protein kinase